MVPEEKERKKIIIESLVIVLCSSTTYILEPFSLFFALISRSKENNLKKIENVWADMLVASKGSSNWSPTLSYSSSRYAKEGPNTPPGSYFDGSSSMDLKLMVNDKYIPTWKILLRSPAVFCFYYAQQEMCKVAEMDSTPH